jgi:hypothetical protein
MADSVVLSRLAATGAVFTSTGSPDAYKLVLLNTEGKIDSSLVTNSITVISVQNSVARLALAATPGTFVYETTTGILYILVSLPNNWLSLTSAVSSVNGRQGQINLDKNDVGLAAVDNTTDLNKPVSTAQAEAIKNTKNQAIAFSIAL